jgi:hypothetical protein
MPLPQAFTNAVREWLEEHGAVECTKTSGKTELMANYRHHVPGKTEEQARQAVKHAVQKIRGVILPQMTNVGLKRKAVGEPRSQHEDERKKTNDIHSGRAKANLASANREELFANPLISHLLLEDHELEREVEKILTTRFAEF